MSYITIGDGTSKDLTPASDLFEPEFEHCARTLNTNTNVLLAIIQEAIGDLKGGEWYRRGPTKYSKVKSSIDEWGICLKETLTRYDGSLYGTITRSGSAYSYIVTEKYYDKHGNLIRSITASEKWTLWEKGDLNDIIRTTYTIMSDSFFES